MGLKYEPASEPLHMSVKQLEEACPARLGTALCSAIVIFLPSQEGTELLKRVHWLSPERHDRNLALTVLCVPHSLHSGACYSAIPASASQYHITKFTTKIAQW